MLADLMLGSSWILRRLVLMGLHVSLKRLSKLVTGEKQLLIAMLKLPIKIAVNNKSII
jgi:hypothetical protein